MTRDERIRGMINALNAIADKTDGRVDRVSIEVSMLAEDAVRLYGDPLDCQRGLLFEEDMHEEATA